MPRLQAIVHIKDLLSCHISENMIDPFICVTIFVFLSNFFALLLHAPSYFKFKTDFKKMLFFIQTI